MDELKNKWIKKKSKDECNSYIIINLLKNYINRYIYIKSRYSHL